MTAFQLFCNKAHRGPGGTLLLLSAIICLNSCGFGGNSDGSSVIGGILTELIKGAASSQPESLELPAITAADNVIEHTGFVLSYNPSTKLPHWVAYELTSEETEGDADRDEFIFKKDPEWKSSQAMREDYAESGWTKGHMACAGDFKWDEDAMEETFYLTNICPQDRELNKGDWNYLEKQVRHWARRYGKAWVVSGPIVGKNKYGKIGERDVTVPDAFFKAVLTPTKGGYQSIAFVMGNDSKRYYLDKCSMSVNELERLTGLDLFTALPDDIEEQTEGQYSPKDWGIKVK